MSTLKASGCSYCGSDKHTSLQCFEKPRTSLSKAKKPMRRESAKHRKERQETNALWFEANPPPIDGLYWICYISKHPLCPYYLTRETVVPEHDNSKARAPDQRHNIEQIFPACTFDNEAKGSLTAKQYLAK